MMKSLIFAVVGILVPVLALPLAAQDLTYVQTSRVEFGGSIGRIMAMMPGMEDTSQEKVFLKGTRMRRDSEDASTIMDWATGEMIILDHVDRTFVRITWAEAVEAMSQVAQGGVAHAEAGMEMEMEEVEDAEPRPTFTTRFDTDRTGRTERINGYEAEQVVVTLEIEGEMPPEETEQDQENELAQGAMAVVSELWLSTDFPEWTMMQEAREEMAESFRASGMGENMQESMGGLSAMDPRIEVAMSENQDALAALEGTAVKTVVNLVAVPPELELEVDAVLAQSDEELAAGMGSLAAAGAGAAARQALGGLRSRFGRQRQEEPAEPEPTQSIFMRITSEIGDVETGDLDDSIFAPPEGYTERPADLPVGRH